ncbi:MAG: hydrolase [Candidatus Rifleibacteriota bacterium]
MRKIPGCLFLVWFCAIAGCLISGELKLTDKTGHVTFQDPSYCDGHVVDLYYRLPERLASDSPVLFVCHGVKRNPEKYLKDWKEYAEKLGVILLAPGFLKGQFPKGRNYNQGYVLDRNRQLNPKEKWTFPVIEEIFMAVKNSLKLSTQSFIIYGHSAGAQFVHRLIIFADKLSCSLAISANPGSLTFLDSKERYPYGLGYLEKLKLDYSEIFKRNFVLMIGLEDKDPNHKYLSRTPESMNEGKNRLERCRNFFASSQKVAKEMSVQFNWRKIEVPGVGHSNKGMAIAAFALIKEHLQGGQPAR